MIEKLYRPSIYTIKIKYQSLNNFCFSFDRSRNNFNRNWLQYFLHFAKLVGKNKGSDYFTENFQVKENKTKMRNIHPRFFHLLF